MTDDASQNAKPAGAQAQVEMPLTDDGAQAQVEMSASQAADVVGAAAADIQQRWLQFSVTVASAIKNGQAVSNGTFEDMRQLREKYEELQKAMHVLRNIKQAGKSER